MSQKKETWDNRPGVSIDTMLKAIDSQAVLIPGVIEHVTPKVREIVAGLDLNKIVNVFTTGCGDSLYAALATRLTFEKYAGLRTEPIEALEFSRYTVDYLTPGSLVVGVSAGGTTSRPVEAVRQAKRAGAVVLAVTGHAESPLAQGADHAIVQNERDYRVPAPPGEGTFGIGNYMGSMLSLYLLALELGRARGHITQAVYDKAIAEMLRAPQIIAATVKANKDPVFALAKSVSTADAFYILGGGPSYATAMFTAAKHFEMPQANGVPVELEEWAHEQFFLARPGTPKLVIAPPGNSVSRAREQMIGARDMGSRVAAICDQNDKETMDLAEVSFPIIGELPEEFSPLTYCVPGELFAVGLCRAQGKQAFAFINNTQYEVNMRQILRSQIR